MGHSIFAIELCAPYQAGDPLLSDLRAVVARHARASGYQAKWQVYRDAGAILHRALPTFVRGCWDFFDDDARARRDFEMWTQGMLTEEGSRKEPSGVPDPYRGDPRFLTFTMAFLLVTGTQMERALAQRCVIPEAHLWTRAVFGHHLASLPYLNFADVAGDVMYLIPRDQEWGLTAQDLAHEKFAYLRAIV